MRAASILFLALLATTAQAATYNKLIKGTDILVIEYGYVASPWNEDKDINLAKVAIPNPNADPRRMEDNLLILDVTVSCSKAVAKTKHFDWAPVDKCEKIRPIYDFLCKRTWAQRVFD